MCLVWKHHQNSEQFVVCLLLPSQISRFCILTCVFHNVTNWFHANSCTFFRSMWFEAPHFNCPLLTAYRVLAIDNKQKCMRQIVEHVSNCQMARTMLCTIDWMWFQSALGSFISMWMSCKAAQWFTCVGFCLHATNKLLCVGVRVHVSRQCSIRMFPRNGFIYTFTVNIKWENQLNSWMELCSRSLGRV